MFTIQKSQKNQPGPTYQVLSEEMVSSVIDRVPGRGHAIKT